MLCYLSQDNCMIYEHPGQWSTERENSLYNIYNLRYLQRTSCHKQTKQKSLSYRRQYIDIDSDRLKHMMYRKPSEIFIYLRFCRIYRVKEIKLYIMCNLFLISCLQQLINCQNCKSYIKIFFGVLSLSRVYGIVF